MAAPKPLAEVLAGIHANRLNQLGQSHPWAELPPQRQAARLDAMATVLDAIGLLGWTAEISEDGVYYMVRRVTPLPREPTGDVPRVPSPTALGPPKPLPSVRAVSRQKGFTGDVCATCGNFEMIRDGKCLKCMSCGSTEGGCS
jgi:hypothetical protein